MGISAYVSTSRSKPSKPTPITQKLSANQVLGNGGYVFQLSDWDAFMRFLILGTEGGTFIVNDERKFTAENAKRVVKCIMTDGKRAVNMIVQVSDAGRAPKNDPAIFALALAASVGDADTRSYALANLSKVCRIPTHLFHFFAFLKGMRGTGRAVRNAISFWYDNLPVDKLAYEVVKYQSRDGWSNADLLRLAHPKTNDIVRNAVYRWVVDGFDGYVASKQKFPRKFGDLPEVILAFEAAKVASDRELKTIIRKANLSREMLPTEALNRPDVWMELLSKGMPFTALIRNLGNMSKHGLLTPMSDASRLVTAQLNDAKGIIKSRVHPISVLVALKTYASGQGLKGKGTWTPVPAVVDALDDAFYLAFDAITPTEKRLLYGIDVSGSMSWDSLAGLPITPAEGAAALALASAKTERDYYIMGFANTFKDLGITKKDTLKSALAKTNAENFGSTDCSLPMSWARKNNVDVDAFIVITDNDTNTGEHPQEELQKYRQARGIAAKEIVVGMTATPFSIADPKDPLTLDVVGFDTATPQAISEFVRGI
jgi:60 kDa SS-A/Ro ribonucleoprotein